MHTTTATTRGTPRANSWSDDWIATVEAKELLYGRRICGSRLMSGAPCTLTSNHPSGRCRFHGGFDLTGAPAGNRNAVIHNLYSRRLMPCGPHCPVWQSCPLTSSLGKGAAARYGEESVSKKKPILSGAGETDAPEGKWDGVPADNPNIQYHSWGFGGVRKQAGGENSYGGAGGSPADGEPETHGGQAARPTDHVDASPSPPTDRSATRSDPYRPEGPFGSTFSSPEEKVDFAAEVLRLHPADRPICPYELTEYNTAVTDALQRLSGSRIGAYGRHIVHMLALAQVMVSRAGLALREAQFTESVEVRSDNYNMTTTKVTAALSAYEKLERAWRRLLNDFERHYNPWGDYEADALYEQRIQNDYDLADTPEEEMAGAGMADAQGADAPSCHSREGGNLKKSSQHPPNKPENPDPPGAVVRPSTDSGVRRNDNGESESGGPSSTLADTDDRSAGTRSRASPDEEDLVPPADQTGESSAESAPH